MGKPAPKRVIIVGYGFRGGQWSQEIARRRDVAVGAVVDPDEESEGRATRSGLRRWASLQEALDSGGVEGAIVATPPTRHVSDAVSCLRSGVGVLVEKPVAPTLASALQLAAEAKRSGRPVLMGQNFRFRPRERTMRRLLHDGAIGSAHLSVVTSARPPETAPAHTTEADLGSFRDIAAHHFDSLRIRFGNVPTVLIASSREQKGLRSYHTEMIFPNELRVLYNHSEGPPLFYYHEWLEGERGAVAAIDERVYVYRRRRRPRRVRTKRVSTPDQIILTSFLHALDGRKQQDLELTHNLGTIAMVEAAEISITTGQSVDMASFMAEAEGSLRGRGQA